MTKPQIFIINGETGETVLRDLNAQELEQQQKDQAAEQAELDKQATQNAARLAAQAKLTALGLTAADLKALGLETALSTPIVNAD